MLVFDYRFNDQRLTEVNFRDTVVFTIIDQRKLLLQWKRLQFKYQTVAL